MLFSFDWMIIYTDYYGALQILFVLYCIVLVTQLGVEVRYDYVFVKIKKS